MKVSWFVFFTACLCLALKSAAQQQRPRVIGVAIVDGENQIDCKAMLSDEGLPRLIPLLESQQMKSIESKNALPPLFITFLNSLFNTPYKFADCEEEWEIDCISMGGARELFVYAGLSESLFALSFQTSDMGYSVNHVYLIRYDGDTILELWSGAKYTDGGEWRVAELNNQARLLAWLNRHKSQPRALHCYNYHGCDY